MPKFGSIGAFFKFDLLLTSSNLWWLLESKCHSLCIGDIIWTWMQKTGSLSAFFKFDLILTSCDLQWPLITFRIKISYQILVGDIIRVFIQKIDPWEYFKVLFKLTLFWSLWAQMIFTYPWGQKNIAYDASWYHMSMHAKNCIDWSYG